MLRAAPRISDRHLRFAAAACAIAVVALSAHNADARVPKAAKNAARVAKKAARAGDNDKAIDYYQTAYDLSDSPGYLYQRAMIEAKIGRYEAAYKRLEKVAAHPKAKRGLRRRARKKLDKIEGAYLSAVEQRKQAENAKRLAQEEADRQERSARRQRAAQEQKEAVAHARLALARRKAEDAARRKRERLEETAARLRAESEWRGTAGWSLLVGGVVIGAGAGYWLTGYFDEQAALNAELGDENSAGRFEGLDYATYKSRQEELNRSAMIGTAGTVVGGIALVTGSALLISRPAVPDVAIGPAFGGRGLLVRGRF